MKIRVNISIDEETHERLKHYAAEHRMNVSQAITQWIWSQKVRYEILPGQTKIKGDKK